MAKLLTLRRIFRLPSGVTGMGFVAVFLNGKITNVSGERAASFWWVTIT
jgi:hypothetical protein